MDDLLQSNENSEPGISCFTFTEKPSIIQNSKTSLQKKRDTLVDEVAVVASSNGTKQRSVMQGEGGENDEALRLSMS